MTATGAFDLNIEEVLIEEVLEHWTVAHAVRHLVSNAVDERTLTGTAPPEIIKDSDHCWHMRDFGRGVRAEHLTQREDLEKLAHPPLIGGSGVGLKDALAVLHRHCARVLLRSRWAEIGRSFRPKHGFEGITTLHGLVSEPSELSMVGTVKRSASRRLRDYAGTLLHEATHVITGAPDATLAIEVGLSTVAGSVAEGALAARDAR